MALAVGMTVFYKGGGKYSKAPYARLPGMIVAVNADNTKCQLKWDMGNGKWDEMPGRTMLLSECTLHAAEDLGMSTPARQRPPDGNANFSDPASPIDDPIDEPERETDPSESDSDDESDGESDDDDVGDGSELEGKIHRVDSDFGSSLTVSNRDHQSNCWVNWKIMGQPCEFQVLLG